MNANAQRGARVQSHKRAPSLDLVRLVQLLAKSIPADPAASGLPAGWPLLDADTELHRLRVNTRGVLARLWGQSDFTKAFEPGPESGFLRDVSQPGRSVDAKVGGRILEDNLSDLSHAISTLRDALKAELDGFLTKDILNLAQLVAPDATQHLSVLAKSVGASFSRGPGTASMVPLQFTNPERTETDRQDDVARLIAAVEEVESSDWLEKFEGPARRKLARRDLDEDDIDGAIDNVKREANRLDSQVVRFLNFLDDEALSRVRLQVTFAIMGALKEATRSRSDVGAKLLVRYVENVETVYQHFCDTEHTWSFDLSAAYGMGGRVNASESLRMAGHYSCLPVWAEWVTQMFEFRPIGAGSLAREVSYRFRINGDNPQQQESAFLSRLGFIEKDLARAEDDASPAVITRSLAQLAFLAVVLPCESDLAHAADPIKAVEKLMGEFKAHGQIAVQRVLETLKARNGEIDRIAAALIQTLKTKGKVLVGAAEKLVREQYVCVQEDVVDWARLASASGSSQDFFIRPAEAGQSENPLWFKHLIVTDNLSKVPGLLFSVRVRTHLRERSLTKSGEAASTTIQRQYAAPAMQVAWRPCEAKKSESGQWSWQRLEAGVGAWLSSSGVDIEYQPESIGRKPHVKKISDEQQRQYHAANVTAFAVLSYMVLWLLRDALGEGAVPEHDLHLLMLRFQTEGRRLQPENDKSISGSEIAYVVSQAVESALSTESPTYMQGMVVGGTADRFRTGGTFAALCSAFPIHISMPAMPAVEKIGLVSYATRPCDFHPAYPAADRFLYIAKSYIAEAASAPSAGYVLHEDRTQTHLQSRQDFEEPALILEEIGRLHEAGCNHIMLLWHHYGNRHIGRTADRHSPHSSPEFLSHVAERFPNVTLYPLRRDVFPATRIRTRLNNETAFEVQRVREHEDFWHPAENEVRKDYVPFYTFATLGYVARNDVDKPQSGFCTYFLESDSRLRQIEWAERARVNLIDPNQDSAVRPCLITVLRGLHFLHAERASGKPVLDPYDWINPTTIGGSGEFKVVTSRRKGGIVLSLPAVLTHVASVLRGGKK